MVMTDEQFETEFGYSRLAPDGTRRYKRGLTKTHKWDGGVVRYSFQQLARDLTALGIGSQLDKKKALLLAAMNTFPSELTFQEAVDGDDRVLEFVSGYPCVDGVHNTTQGGSWCWSMVGDVGLTGISTDFTRVTPLNLDAFDSSGHCWTSGTIIHELGHAVGLHHEQSRPDRDNYVAVADAGQSVKASVTAVGSLGIEYDFKSIMHYPLSADLTVAVGLGEEQLARQGIEASAVGTGNELSALDVLGLQYMYGTGTPPTSSTRTVSSTTVTVTTITATSATTTTTTTTITGTTVTTSTVTTTTDPTVVCGNASRTYVDSRSGKLFHFIERDVMMDDAEHAALYGGAAGPARERRGLTRSDKWVDGTVAYSFAQLAVDLTALGIGSQFDAKQAQVKTVMNYISTIAGVIFKEAVEGEDEHVLEIVSGYTELDPASFTAGGGSWCWSFVGDKAFEGVSSFWLMSTQWSTVLTGTSVSCSCNCKQ
jgi:hypothetical protein